MLTNFRSISKYRVEALDGNVGNIHELLFDEQSWIVRYIVINTGNLFMKNLVLLQPEEFVSCDTDEEKFLVNLTKEEIINSPSVEAVKKTNYYWPNYWVGTHLTYGWTPFNPYSKKIYTEPGINSTHEMHVYKVKAVDEQIGSVDNFIVNTEAWYISNMIINTGFSLLPGKKISVTADNVKEINNQQNFVLLDMNAQEVKNYPGYESKKSFRHIIGRPADLITS
ncbi:MAG: hypothetical protein HYS25_10580 [Ignavibacteriales bacterium]|nr:hypothetical protein [Ignavibacteriales bacterium]